MEQVSNDFDFVSRERFHRLLVSRKRLQRCDDESLHLRGLLDVDTGRCYLIRESDLFPPMVQTKRIGRDAAILV